MIFPHHIHFWVVHWLSSTKLAGFNIGIGKLCKLSDCIDTRYGSLIDVMLKIYEHFSCHELFKRKLFWNRFIFYCIFGAWMLLQVTQQTVDFIFIFHWRMDLSIQSVHNHKIEWHKPEKTITRIIWTSSKIDLKNGNENILYIDSMLLTVHNI